MNSINHLFFKDYKHYLFIFLGIVLLSLFFIWIQSSKNIPSDDDIIFQISDNIPEGFVMVPIELENHESISDLITSHGVVDLYYRPSPHSQPLKIARAIRIIRLQPFRFVVLIPEEKISTFLSSSLHFYAVVQNINKQGVIVYGKKKKRSITIEEENTFNEM